MDFKNIDNKYRFTPIWSWNEKLNISETKGQIELFKQSGMGGFIIHARDGIKSAYMGDEFFRNITQSLNDAESNNMTCWICDENGFPSGSGGGAINSKGLDYQQKFLRMEAGEKTNDRTIICKDGYHFYYDVNPSYIDTLNPDTVRCFIDETYEKYIDKQNGFEGFYTYEPQISNDAIPWSFILPAEYKKEYNEELLDKLEELFRPVDDYENTRVKFWHLVTKLFSNNYTKQIFNWCNEHGIKLAGHFAHADTTCANGAVMTNYKYLHTPGIKSSYKDSNNPLLPIQAASVAHQFGKKEVLAELFSNCNNSMCIDDFKRTAEFQMVRGITKICPHTAPYSLRGFRKESCQPAFFYQQPWWDGIRLLSDSLSRICMILSEGKVKFDTLLISNNTSVWAEFNDSDSITNEYTEAMLDSIKTLEKKHIPFHIGDEVIISQNARVENGAFVIDTQRYTNIVLPKHKTLLPSTEALLSEFERAGGNIVLAENLVSNDVCDKEELTYTIRYFDDFTAHYFVNSTDKEFVSAIDCGSKMLDITTGEIAPFYGVYKFHPYESLVIIDDGTPMQSRPFKKQLKELDISGEWQIKECSENALAIDICDLYFDDELVGENEYSRDVIYKAANLNRNVNIKCDYHFNIKSIPENIYLACETPEVFSITVNGTELNSEDLGYYLYPALRKLEFRDLLTEGENVISLNLEFSPSLKSGEIINEIKAEIEPIYIVGNFSVCTDGKFLKLDKNACRYVGGFYIDQPIETVNSINLEKQGFPFFCGQMTLSKKFNISDTGYMINMSKKGISSLKVTVNQNSITPLLLDPCEVNLSDYLQKGDNEIEITISSTLRNLFGPHHLPTGENLSVTPAHFHKEPCVWNNNTPTPWEENYCFMELGFDNLTTNE